MLKRWLSSHPMFRISNECGPKHPDFAPCAKTAPHGQSRGQSLPLPVEDLLLYPVEPQKEKIKQYPKSYYNILNDALVATVSEDNVVTSLLTIGEAPKYLFEGYLEDREGIEKNSIETFLIVTKIIGFDTNRTMSLL